MRFLFLAISRSIRGLCKECFCQRFSAEKHSPRLSDAEGRILLPKFSVCEKGRPLDFLSSGVRCALILQQRPSVCETARIRFFEIWGLPVLAPPQKPKIHRAARSPKELAFLRKISPDLIRKRYTDDKDLLTELFSSLDKLLEQERMYRDLPFDKSPCFEAKFSDLSEEKIMWFLERARRSRSWNVKSNASPATILRKLHLYSEDGYLLNPALLLFGNDPQKFFTTSVVKCMHFHSTEKYKPIPSYQVYYGNLFDMIDSAVDFVMSKIDRRVGERTESPTAPVTYEIPLPVVMEAIVNAVSHRLYTSNGSVQVMLFSDRLEIANPGELIPSFPVEELSHDHESHPVNPHIAESFFLAQYAENVGSGTTDMIRICREAGLRPPVYQYEHGTFRTIIYRNTNRLSDRLSDQLSDKLSDRLSDKLSDRRIAILQKMIGDPQISLTDLAQQTGISRAAIIKNIAWLKENGYLKREGNNRQGHWVVLSGNDTPEQKP